jgi:MFS family permease
MDSPFTGRQRAALAVLLTAGFTLAADFSILTVALPVIGRDAGLPLGSLQWVSTSFALCAAGFTLLFGRLADLTGRRRLFLTGMAVLGAASLAGGLATGPAVLLTARVAQGLATAAVTPAALSLLTTAFPAGPGRDRALGLNGAVMAAGFTAGAILGGLLTGLLSWRWAFFVNVAVAVAVLVAGPAVLAESRPPARPPLDLPGAVTVTGGLLLLVYGLTGATTRPWSHPVVVVPLVAGAALLALFAAIEHRARQPLLPVRFLAARPVAWGNAAGLLAFATETSLVFLLTLYLQDVLGVSPLAAGLCFAVLGAGTVLGGLLAPRVIARAGTRRTLAAALTVQAAATAPLALLGPDRAWLPLVLAAAFAGGVANLVAIVAFMVTVTGAVAPHEQGLATGLATLSQQVGITVGTPVMSTIALAGGDLLAGLSRAIAANAALALITAAAVAVALAPRRHHRDPVVHHG